MFDTRAYEVEYLDGHKESLGVNTIAENIFSQVDEEGSRFVLFDEVVNHRVDGTETMQQGAFVVSNNSGKRRGKTTKGWEILIQWKDSSTTWESMKYVKKLYPLQIAEYYHQIRISQEPTFA